MYAADPDLDIAILHVSAADLPYVGIGDSDAVTAGESVNAVGYPFGSVLELEARRCGHRLADAVAERWHDLGAAASMPPAIADSCS